MEAGVVGEMLVRSKLVCGVWLCRVMGGAGDSDGESTVAVSTDVVCGEKKVILPTDSAFGDVGTGIVGSCGVVVFVNPGGGEEVATFGE